MRCCRGAVDDSGEADEASVRGDIIGFFSREDGVARGNTRELRTGELRTRLLGTGCLRTGKLWAYKSLTEGLWAWCDVGGGNWRWRGGELGGVFS